MLTHIFLISYGFMYPLIVDVDLFMREFGKIMGSHFSNLDNSKQQQQSAISPSPLAAPIQEIGPLHAQAIANSKKATTEASSKCGSSSSSSSSSSEDDRLKEIVNDPELSAMLLDPNLQRILVECGDPVKFQMHMQDPVIANKIRRMYQAGLVGTAK